MANPSPLVSISMSVLNGQETLPQAIASVLLQTCPDWELFIMDDGSTDRTIELARTVRDPRVHVDADGKRLGVAARHNRALALSQGKFFAIMDADDVAYPNRLERQVGYLEQHPDVDLVGARAIVFRSDGRAIGQRAAPESMEAICARPTAGFPMTHPTFLGHLEWFRRYRYVERGLGAASEDHDLLLRSYRESVLANVPEILLGYREDRLDLGKILRMRRMFARSLFREFSRRGQWRLALQGVGGQVAKGALDCIAITTGLDYALLRHRARAIDEAERQEWSRVWRQVSAGIGMAGAFEKSLGPA